MIAATEESVGELAGAEVKRLALHSSHYLIGLLCTLALGLISFPIFTRMFSVAEYGTIDLAQKVMLMLTVLSKGGLQNAAVRFYDEGQFNADGRTARTYYSTMLFGVAGNAFAVATLFLTAFWLWPKGGSLVYLIAALAMLRAVGSILWAFLRVEERTVAFNVITIGTRAATILAICLLLPFAGAYASTYLAGVVLVELVLVVGLVTWLVQRRLLTVEGFDRSLCWAGVGFGMPLVLYEFGFTALGSVDRFLVRNFLGADPLGIYSVAYGLSQHANELLLGPLTLALAPIYMKLWMSKGNASTAQFLSTGLDVYAMFACGIMAIVIATAQDLVKVLASAKYAGADDLIPWLLGGLLIYATHVFIVAGLMIHKKTITMAAILALAACCNIALNCVLLPLLGLTGAAFATVLSYVLCIALLARASRPYLALKICPRAIFAYAIAGAVACLIAMLVPSGSPLMNLAVRPEIVVLSYLCILYALDVRVRRVALMGWRFAGRYVSV